MAELFGNVTEGNWRSEETFTRLPELGGTILGGLSLRHFSARSTRRGRQHSRARRAAPPFSRGSSSQPRPPAVLSL